MVKTWVRSKLDRVISNTPCHVYSIIMTPDDTQNACNVVLYDGESTGDPRVLGVRTGAGVTRMLHFNPPLQTQRGLYLDAGDNVDDVLIQFAWEHE